jgi:copper chaperone CopZ
MVDDTNVEIIQSPEAPVIETTTIGIEGMTCDRCVQKVEQALRGARGVKDVSVDLKSATATITFDSRITHFPDLHDRLLASGYKPTRSAS